jgi:hypothetical protein
MVVPASTYQHDTPRAYQDVDTSATVEVVDPAHPLYGRRFPVARTSTTVTGPGYVWVVYRDFMRLRLPLASTNLVPAHPQVRTTFTTQAIADLLALAGSCALWEAGIDACPPSPANQPNRATSGDGCPLSCASRSASN